MKKITIDFQGRPLSIEMGRLAKQANGAAWVQYGDTALLVTAVAGTEDKVGQSFLPLSVDYIERFSSAGRIPGGFFKREGRQTEHETLVSRVIDRPIRPLFPETYCRDTQIIATLFSYDPDADPDALALLGASAALHVSDIPFLGPIASVRMGRINGQLVCNPKLSEMPQSDLDITIAASKDAIVMVEGEAKEVPESEILAALKAGFEHIQPLLKLQEDLRAAIGLPKFPVPPANPDLIKLKDAVVAEAGAAIDELLKIKEKMPRYRKLAALKKETVAKLTAETSPVKDIASGVGDVFSGLVSDKIRQQVVKEKRRLDGRSPKDVRNIWIETSVLPRTHGSAVFTRGETQALVTVTLGTSTDAQIIDAIQGESKRYFMLHYNFPPYSVGEVKFMRAPARREVGHGVLAHKSVAQVMPSHDEYPYTVRVISDVLESHGSSSMATVCGATLSLMDAGVPIKAPVAGIAMGLVKEGDEFIVLSDISGDEDHIGDMDFKVAGTQKGVTGVQMDIKIEGLSWAIMEQALQQAQEGRMHILSKMNEALAAPRPEMSPFAPRMETIQVHTDKIREVIGSGGKVIRGIVEKSGAEVDIDDSGKVTIASPNADSLRIAREMVEAIVAEAEVGKLYKGKVTRVMEYGAFVEILPGKDGLCHVSEMLSTERIEDANDVVKVGDEMEVVVLAVDQQGKIKLSHKEALEPGVHTRPERPERSRSENVGRMKERHREGRGGDRGGSRRARF